MVNKIFAFSLAVLTPGLVIGLFSFSAGAFFMVTIVASAHALALGLPLYLFLNKVKLVNVYTSCASGIFVAVIPIAIWAWPSKNIEMKTTASNSSYGQTMVDGIPTAAGWLQYFHVVLYFAGIGLGCGLVFWLTIKTRPLFKRNAKS